MSENHLENWPEGFYQIGDIRERRALLDEAIAQQLEASDGALVSIWNTRYVKNKSMNVEVQDRFMYAFLMIQALSENGYILKGPMRKKLGRYFDELQLTRFSELSESEQALLREEYRHMAGLYVSSCMGSKNYGAVLSLIPIKQDQRGRKMMDGIEKALVAFPRKLGMESISAPLYQIFLEIYQKVSAPSED